MSIGPINDPNIDLLGIGFKLTNKNSIEKEDFQAIDTILSNNKDQITADTCKYFYNQLRLVEVNYSDKKYLEILNKIYKIYQEKSPQVGIRHASDQEAAQSTPMKVSNTILSFLRETGQDQSSPTSSPSPSGMSTPPGGASFGASPTATPPRSESPIVNLSDFEDKGERSEETHANFIERLLDKPEGKEAIYGVLDMIDLATFEVEENSSVEEKISWFKKIAQKIYGAPDGTNLNPREKKELLGYVENFFKKAKDLGDVEAGVALVKLIIERDGKDNPKRVFEDFKDSQGLSFEKFGLAQCYFQGIGVERNPEEAEKLLDQIEADYDEDLEFEPLMNEVLNLKAEINRQRGNGNTKRG